MPLQIGKTPIVVPRQHQYNEHVNDHQVEFARNVAQRMGTIIPVEDINTLGDVITNYDQIVAGMDNISRIKEKCVGCKSCEQSCPKHCISNVACTQILAPMGRERYTMYSTIAGAFVNLVANSVLIPQMGASGAALGTVIAEITVAIIQIYYARDFYLPLLRKKDFGKIAIGCFAAIAALGL